MMGRNHLIVNGAVCAGSLGVCCSVVISKVSNVQDLSLSVLKYFYPASLCGNISWDLLSFWPIYLLCSLLLLAFGSLLPDIDSKESILGRFLYLPVRHRTWTHSIWFVIPLVCLGLIHPILRFIWLGCFLHILADEFSRGGVCFLYPIHAYRRYPNGAFVAIGHKMKLYHTGDKSELRCVIAVCVISILICAICFRGFISFWQWITI